MGDNVESEHSSVGGSRDSGSSSDSSSGSSEGEEDTTEVIRVLGHTLELPQELCENYAIFKEVFSMRTWESLGDHHKELLKKYLPTFAANDEEEKERTVRMLFDFEPFHFTSPLDTFFSNLRNGNYRPDIAKMRKFLMKARRKQQKQRMKTYYAKLLPEVLVSRERLLAAAKAAPPDRVPALPALPCKRKTYYKPVHARVKQRYFEELASIRRETGDGGAAVSDDENYPEGPPNGNIDTKGQQSVRDISGTMVAAESSERTSLECLKSVLAAHRARRHYRDNHPELNTTGITLEDIKQRVAFVNGAKKLMFGGQKGDGVQRVKRAYNKKDPDRKKMKKDEESVENKPLLPNIKIKCEQEESDSEASSFVDPVASPRVGRKGSDAVEVKQEAVDNRYAAGNVNNISMDPDTQCVIKQEPEEHSAQYARAVQPVPIKLEDLDGIDMMALPIEIADDCGEVTVNTSEQLDGDDALTETTYANFLCLVRALFPARSAHRASKHELKARCAAVISSPIAPLNTWYHLSEDWCSELDCALEFLAGDRGPHPEDFVPYLQYIPDTQMYQWIGAGRDSDATLGRLCERWTRSDNNAPMSRLPPPKHPTSFVVRQPTSTELAEFRRLERKRFANAAKPFTYQQFGYRSVVGPCGRAPAAGGAATHSALLRPERPPHATMLALVKDAVARLPNGQGTKHDVITLLRMSQWVSASSDQSLLSAVSAALERLVSAKRDPVVKYEQRTGVWTYLHRNRSEDDWLLKCSGRRSKTAKTRELQTVQSEADHSSPEKQLDQDPHQLPVEEKIIKSPESGSDFEVDVLCDSPPPGQLSSAQLLMRTTNNDQAPPPPKSKGKLVAVSPQKAKAILKQASIKANSQQSNLVTQAIKQANQLAQTTKNTPKQVAKQAQVKNATQKQVVSPKQAPSTTKPNLMAQSAKQASVIAQLTKPPPKNIVTQPKTVIKPVQSPKSNIKQASIAKHDIGTKQNIIETQIDMKEANIVTKQENNIVPSNLPKQDDVFQQQNNVSMQENVVFQQQTNVPKQGTVVFQQQSKAHKPDTTVFQQHSIIPKQDTILFQQQINTPKQDTIVLQQQSHVPKQETIVIQQQSNVPKQDTIVFQQQSNVPKQDTIVFQQQNVPKQDTIIFQQKSNVPKHETVVYQQQSNVSKQENFSKQQSNISIQGTVILQQQSNVPKQETIILRQSNAPKQETIVFKQQSNTPKQEKIIIHQGNTPKQDTIVFQQQGNVANQEMIVFQQQSNAPKQEMIIFQQQSGAPKQETIIFKQQSHVPKQEITFQESPKETTPKQTSKPTIISNIPIQQHILQGQLTHLKTSSQLKTPSQTKTQNQAKTQTQVKQEAHKKTLPTIVATRSPLLKQRPLQKQIELPENQSPASQPQPQATRSLLIRAPAAHSTAATLVPAANNQSTAGNQRRGLVRVLSPAAPAAGKSLISPRALVHQNTPGAKKRALETTPTSTQVQSSPVPSVSTAATTTPSPRTVQLSTGQRLQLAANQTVHLPTGQAVQLQLSALQLQNLGTHSVRLPSGQTVQLASPQSIKLSKNQSPKFKTQPGIQIPISSVQLTGQTVQIGGQTVQIAGQSVQLTGHTVKLPSGQSVQMASPSVISQNLLQRQVQLAQTVQLGQNVQLGGQNVQLSGQNVQLGGQTVQLGGQTVQLPAGQTIQLASGQTIQLASPQTVQLTNPVKTTHKSQAVIEGVTQPVVGKLLTSTQSVVAEGGNRVVPAARLTRPLLLATGKPLHNIILQQSDGSTIRVTSSGAAATSQTIVFSNIGAQNVTTNTTSTPVLKLQQVNPLQQIKLAQGIKLQQASGSSGTMRGVVMDGQQLKLVRILQHQPHHQ